MPIIIEDTTREIATNAISPYETASIIVVTPDISSAT